MKTMKYPRFLLFIQLLWLFCPLLSAKPNPDYEPERVNKAIELLEKGQPVYYTYGVKPPDYPWTIEEAYERGKAMSQTWADMIVYNLEHGAFDMTALRAYMQGLYDGGPTPSGHPTPAVIVVLPILGISPEAVEGSHWMIHQALAHGVHGLHLARARDPEAVRRFIRIARYPIHEQGLNRGLQGGLRGMGSNAFAQKIWNLSKAEYFNKADVWPLNPEGELLLGLKIEDPQALAMVEQTATIPGIGFLESGPRDMGLSYGYLEGRADPPLPEEVIAASQRVLDAARENDIPFLDNVLPDNVIKRLEWGVSIAAGGNEEAARIGREHTDREMPW